jgi:hypothetical protein
MSYRSTYEEAPARARLEAEAADIEDDSYDVADHLARTVDRTHLSDSPGSDSGRWFPHAITRDPRLMLTRIV